jgi:molecular chaperone HtpG
MEGNYANYSVTVTARQGRFRLTGLQRELDQTWAVLGEVYGLQVHTGLNLLGLRIRRVKSNIDDVAEFAKTVPYVPDQIAFEAANADLLKLLVAPLYGDNPGIGLRELFQNSVDAVREFNDLASRNSAVLLVDRYEQDADVTLKIDCDENGLPLEIVITDRGIGMTAETVRDYFLKVGASFRNSMVWRQEYEDGDGHSQVLRTGRFGVGALAAYLLGDSIEVTSRHAVSLETEGVIFRARLDDESISLERISCPVGTRISIKVPERSRKHIEQILPASWQDIIDYGSGVGHYFLKKPSLARHFQNRPNLPVQGWLPQPEDSAFDDWRCFENTTFEKVFWTYRDNCPHLSSNGIVIETERPSHDSLREFIATPNISVFDKDGKLPVNLQRTGLRGPLPFVDDLLRSIAEDLLAYALIEAPDTCEVPWFDGTYEGFFTTPYQQSIYQSDWDRWLVGREGFVLNTPPLAKMCQPKRIVTIIGGGPHRQIWGEALRRALPNDTLFVSQLHDVFSDDNPKIKGVFQSAIWGRRFDHFTLTDHRTYIPQILIDKIKTLRPGRQVANDLALIEEAPRKGDWSIAGIGESAPWLEGILSSLPFENTSMILSIGGVDFSEHSGALQPLADRWMEVAATPIVPFEIQKRKALVKLAERTIGPLLQLRREKMEIEWKEQDNK